MSKSTSKVGTLILSSIFTASTVLSTAGIASSGPAADRLPPLESKSAQDAELVAKKIIDGTFSAESIESANRVVVLERVKQRLISEATDAEGVDQDLIAYVDQLIEDAKASDEMLELAQGVNLENDTVIVDLSEVDAEALEAVSLQAVDRLDQSLSQDQSEVDNPKDDTQSVDMTEEPSLAEKWTAIKTALDDSYNSSVDSYNENVSPIISDVMQASKDVLPTEQQVEYAYYAVKYQFLKGAILKLKGQQYVIEKAIEHKASLVDEPILIELGVDATLGLVTYGMLKAFHVKEVRKPVGLGQSLKARVQGGASKMAALGKYVQDSLKKTSLDRELGRLEGMRNITIGTETRNANRVIGEISGEINDVTRQISVNVETRKALTAASLTERERDARNLKIVELEKANQNLISRKAELEINLKTAQADLDIKVNEIKNAYNPKIAKVESQLSNMRSTSTKVTARGGEFNRRTVVKKSPLAKVASGAKTTVVFAAKLSGKVVKTSLVYGIPIGAFAYATHGVVSNVPFMAFENYEDFQATIKGIEAERERLMMLMDNLQD